MKEINQKQLTNLISKTFKDINFPVFRNFWTTKPKTKAGSNERSEIFEFWNNNVSFEILMREIEAKSIKRSKLETFEYIKL